MEVGGAIWRYVRRHPIWLAIGGSDAVFRGGSGGVSGFFHRFMAHACYEVFPRPDEGYLIHPIRFCVRFFITHYIANSSRFRKFATELIGVDIHGFFEFGFLGLCLFYLIVTLCYIPLAVFVWLVLYPLLRRIATRYVITAVTVKLRHYRLLKAE